MDNAISRVAFATDINKLKVEGWRMKDEGGCDVEKLMISWNFSQMHLLMTKSKGEIVYLRVSVPQECLG